jgi:hypothetical protein
MPANTVVFLHEYASRSLVREEQDVELEEDPSYETGTRCLLQWVQSLVVPDAVMVSLRLTLV